MELSGQVHAPTVLATGEIVPHSWRNLSGKFVLKQILDRPPLNEGRLMLHISTRNIIYGSVPTHDI